MNKASATQQPNASSFIPSVMLQRNCACGKHTVAGGECAECAKKKTGLQRKLAIGASNDPLEYEADRIAEQVMSTPLNSAINSTPLRIQRFSGQANEWAKTAPATVERVLADSGRPLEPTLQQDMEQRFGHDFSEVRVHTSGVAEQSTRDVNAHAYTAGNNIVFAAGRFAPHTNEGQRLLAHELTHVVQQSSNAGNVLQKQKIGDFEGGDFNTQILEDYLIKFKAGNIEDNMDSDDKARTIVKLWKNGKFGSLGPHEKILLIQEMQSGFTGNDDERAILTILKNSSLADLEIIFGPNGIDPKDLDSDFHGTEEDSLRDFYDRVFLGGRKAVFKGSRELKHTKEPEVRLENQKPTQTQQAEPPPIKLGTPNSAKSCDELCGEGKCERAPEEQCKPEEDAMIFKAWKDAAKNAAKAVDVLNETPTSSATIQSLKENFKWNGSIPTDLPKQVAKNLQDGLDKMTTNLCIRCVHGCPQGNPIQIYRALGQNCLNHNCFAVCPDEFKKDPNKPHAMLHELMHRVVTGGAKMDLYRGQPGYPGGSASVALTMPDTYVSVVDDLISK